MAFSDPPPTKPTGEGWKIAAWLGGGCLVVVLGVAQLAILVAWGNSRVADKKLQLEKARAQAIRKARAIEHPTLPVWLPVYPGTQARGAAGRREGEVALGRTEDAPEKVLGFYADRLQAKGFAVEPRTEAAQVWRLHARRQDGSELTVQSGQGHSGTWIVLTYKDGG